MQYLDELAALEAAERGDRRITRLLKDAKLPREKTLATLELARFLTAVRTQIGHLAQGEFSRGQPTCASSAIPASARPT